MAACHFCKVSFILGETAFRTGDNSGCFCVSAALQGVVEAFPFTGFVHKKTQVLLIGGVQALRKISDPADFRDDSATGLLCSFLGNTIPAFQLFGAAAFVQFSNTALTGKEADFKSPCFDGLLDYIVCPVAALREPAKNRCFQAGFGLAGGNLNHFGFHFFFRGFDNPAFIIAAFGVTENHIISGAEAQNMHVFGISARHNGCSAENIGSCDEESWHMQSLRIIFFHFYH